MVSPGLSAEGLARLRDVLAAHVASGELPGLVALVARGDNVYLGTTTSGPSGPASAVARYVGWR